MIYIRLRLAGSSAERTPGAYIEEREVSIVFRYKSFGSGDEEEGEKQRNNQGQPQNPKGDRDWAKRQAAEAQNHIYDRLVLIGLLLVQDR